VNELLDWLRDWLTIYTWKELWVIVSVPTAIMGVWFLFTWLLSIPNDIIRTVAIWSLIFTLTLASETVRALRKQKARV
jgi:hypothetical protein